MEFIKKTFRRNGRGFTLIELLVVIAIIGILASIVLASLNTARRKSRDARRIADIKRIQLALELYADASGQLYPVATASCDATANAYGLQVLAPGNIPVIPRDPNNTTDRCYRYASSTATPLAQYHLGATLEESTNAALNGDRDCASGTADSCSPGAVYTAGFNGILAASCGAAAGATDFCYDVTN